MKQRDVILIVDDMEINRAILRGLFEQDYSLIEAENGDQAMMLLKQYQDSVAAILLDLMMPVKNGYQFMEEMSKDGYLSKIPVIIITSEDSLENELRSYDLGATDIIMKPFEPHVVKRRVRNAIELNLHKLHLEELVAEQAENLRESTEVLMDTLSSVIEHRSVESGRHVLRIRMFTKVLLEDVMKSYPEYDLDEHSISVIARASALHDIGKIAIPDAILNKPGKLTKEEFDIMKTHSEKGCEILSGLYRMHDKEYLQYAYNICRYHHERWDGKGYPDGLKGDNIPICAQAVGIADAYDALTTDRVYKKAYSHEKAMTMILNGECGVFSPKLLECFKGVRETFARLAGSYTDGFPPAADTVSLVAASSSARPDELNTLQLAQLKYFTMLRYVDSTVVEADLDSGVYHLVYAQNGDFEDLRKENTLDSALKLFSETSVHPDDREIFNGFLGEYTRDLFSEGRFKSSRSCRVFQRTTGAYIPYEMTALRVDINDPEHHKILIVFREAGARAASAEVYDGDAAAVLQDLRVGVLQCVNDKRYSVSNVNQGFISLFGYTKRDLEEQCHNSYLEIVHPDDRQAAVQEFRAQLCHGNAQEMEYRVVTKDGRTVWVLDKWQLVVKDGCEYLNCVLMDFTHVKQSQEELRLTMERHRIIMDQTNDIIFEWDIAGNSLSFSQNWEKNFGYQPITDQIDVKIPNASHILPDDIPVFKSLMKSVISGRQYVEGEIRIANADGRYRWCRIRATTQFGGGGKPVKAVGVIVDVDREKRLAQDLIDRAERDALTRLYNNSAARHRIQHMLDGRAENDRGAMLIIDLDNFKLVNDLHGHMFGDAVLTEIASRLKQIFRMDDIVARIGGDEFLVYMSDGAGERVEECATGVVGAFRNILGDTLQDCKLSCSIGISRCPEDGTDFQTLYQRCDQALYQAKQLGKNRFVAYDSSMGKKFGLSSERMTASTRIESDDGSDETTGLVQVAFKYLYESGDIEKAVGAILEMVGRKYNVSRVYIFEDIEDGKACSNTFEWCNNGILSEIESLRRVTYDELGGNYHDNFNENGVFYCQDISVLPKEQYDILSKQGIKSLLQCAIRDDGRFVGYVGFDDCTIRRLWTQNQIDALTFISELLSTFLLKKRAEDKAIAVAEDLRTALDLQNSWIYIVDPDTYVLRYINRKTKTIAPDAKLGMCCYEAFFGRTVPCEICPARNIREKQNQTLEICNPMLGVWSMADASLIRWENKDACLLSCHDITPYKTGVSAEKNKKR